jgi:ribosome-associated protein
VLAPLRIAAHVVIPASDLSWSAARSSGPGGQNVNKVASKVELRFDLEGTQALSPAVKARLRALAKHRLDAEGRVRMVSQRTRDQGRNLQDTLDKLTELVRAALVAPKPRRPTKPTRGSRVRRVEAKQRLAQKKRWRGRVQTDD